MARNSALLKANPEGTRETWIHQEAVLNSCGHELFLVLHSSATALRFERVLGKSSATLNFFKCQRSRGGPSFTVIFASTYTTATAQKQKWNNWRHDAAFGLFVLQWGFAVCWQWQSGAGTTAVRIWPTRIVVSWLAWRYTQVRDRG